MYLKFNSITKTLVQKKTHRVFVKFFFYLKIILWRVSLIREREVSFDRPIPGPIIFPQIFIISSSVQIELRVTLVGTMSKRRFLSNFLRKKCKCIWVIWLKCKLKTSVFQYKFFRNMCPLGIKHTLKIESRIITGIQNIHS